MSSPRPVTTGLFEEGADGARLLAARCAACARLHFPASTVCPYCSAEGCAAVRVGPAARLCLYTAVHTRPPGYQGEVPYGFGVVEMDGGLRVIARLTEARLDRLRPGLPMRLVVTPLHTRDGETASSYAFRPEAG